VAADYVRQAQLVGNRRRDITGFPFSPATLQCKADTVEVMLRLSEQCWLCSNRAVATKG
jgi:hypothetical protein